ncbi:hypothetical protein [Cohnella boryungensis]|uniref:Fe/B12 periplasmic-binding domain-containing protein n=1 Tax=Cohnella boryungensis TaxID=768479 RepID=A0ABV8S819_9BACL
MKESIRERERKAFQLKAQNILLSESSDIKPNPEAILAAKPDLIVLLAEPSSKGSIDRGWISTIRVG